MDIGPLAVQTRFDFREDAAIFGLCLTSGRSFFIRTTHDINENEISLAPDSTFSANPMLHHGNWATNRLTRNVLEFEWRNRKHFISSVQIP
jgi:hypothetical protein